MNKRFAEHYSGLTVGDAIKLNQIAINGWSQEEARRQLR